MILFFYKDSPSFTPSPAPTGPSDPNSLGRLSHFLSPQDSPLLQRFTKRYPLPSAHITSSAPNDPNSLCRLGQGASFFLPLSCLFPFARTFFSSPYFVFTLPYYFPCPYYTDLFFFSNYSFLHFQKWNVAGAKICNTNLCFVLFVGQCVRRKLFLFWDKMNFWGTDLIVGRYFGRATPRPPQ